MAAAFPRLPPKGDCVSVWVGNIPYNASESLIKDALSEYTEVVNIKIIRDFETDKSKGYGFALLKNQAAASHLLSIPRGEIKIGRRALKIKHAHSNQIHDESLPGNAKYKKHILSTELYDLAPLDPRRVSGHVLVDDVMFNIFRKLDPFLLPSLEIVCRRWQGLVYRMLGGSSTVDFAASGSMWGDFAARITRSRFSSSHRRRLTLAISKMLLLNSDHITELNLGPYPTDHMIITAIGQLAPRLEALTVQCGTILTPASIRPVVLTPVVEGCPSLKHVTLQGKFPGDDTLEHLSACSTLESLSLRCINITPKHFQQLPATITKLELFNVEGLTSTNILEVLKRFTHLRWLTFYSSNDFKRRFTFFSPGGRRQVMKQAMLDSLATMCPLLEHLEVVFDSMMGEDLVTPDFSSFGNLKLLRLVVHTTDMKKLFKDCLPPLTDLRIKFTLNQHDNLPHMKLTEAPASLESITFRRMTIFDKETIAVLTNLPNLKRIFFKFAKVPDEAIKSFAKCLSLREIGLYQTTMTPELYKQLVKLRQKAWSSKQSRTGAIPQLVIRVLANVKFTSSTPDCVLVNTSLKYVREDDTGSVDYDSARKINRYGSEDDEDDDDDYYNEDFDDDYDDDDDDDDDDDLFDDYMYGDDYALDGEFDEDLDDFLQVVHFLNDMAGDDLYDDWN